MRGILDRLFPKCLLVELVPPVSDAVLFMEIPTTKNSITAGPFISDSNSTATLSRETVEAFIRDAYKDFPMDYGSVGPGPTVQVVIRVESKSSLQNAIRALENDWPEDAEELKPMLTRRGLLRVPVERRVRLSAKSRKLVICLQIPEQG